MRTFAKGRRAPLTLAQAAAATGRMKPGENPRNAAARLLLELQAAEEQGNECLSRTPGGQYRTTVSAVESSIGLIAKESERDRQVSAVAERQSEIDEESSAHGRAIIEIVKALQMTGEALVGNAKEHGELRTRCSRLERAVFGGVYQSPPKVKRRPRRYDNRVRTEALRLIASGLSIRAAARAVGVGLATVSRWVSSQAFRGTVDSVQPGATQRKESTHATSEAT